MSRKFGVKFYNINLFIAPDYVKAAVEATKNGIFDFMEIQVLPNTFNETGQKLKELIGSEALVVIHAPHSEQGLNMGDAAKEKRNRDMLIDAQKMADLFSSEIIILHPGEGIGQKYLDETCRQFRKLNDSRLTVENMPYWDNISQDYLHGSTPREIQYIMQKVGCPFCMDFSHAVCSALNGKRDVFDDLSAYAALKPKHFHLCGGDITKAEDQHAYVREGTYPTDTFLKNYVPDGATITLEIPFKKDDFHENIADVNYLKEIDKNI